MTNKIALITGGGRGLGKDMALRLAEQGTNLIITWHSQEETAWQTQKEIEALGRKCLVTYLNVADIKSFHDFFETLAPAMQQTFGTTQFDYLINNGGFGATVPFEKVNEEIFDAFLNTHFKGVYFFTQQAIAKMNDGGSIINISSGTTKFANFGYSVYASMKGALEVFTVYLAKDLGPRGIRVNALAPGAIATDFNNANVRNNPQVQARILENTALGRIGEAGDIGGVAAFLCSDASKWITGQRIEASGGARL